MTMLAAANGALEGALLRQSVASPSGLELPRRELYDLLWSYYLSNGLYDKIATALREAGEGTEAMKELRNPVHRVIEFHTAKLWAGNLPRALPIVTARRQIVAPIHQIWSWSNWANKKQLASRFFSLFGDLFVKVATRQTSDGETRVFFQVLDPRYVTDFSVDERGYLQSIRIDVPQTEYVTDRGLFWERPRIVTRGTYWTEVWDKQRVRVWNNPAGPRELVDNLHKPDSRADPAERDEEHNLGFVPIVWAPFKDIGEGRGLGVITPFISKVDEVNRMSTRLHEMLFRYNKVLWALKSNMTDAQGRPLPPPRITSGNGTAIDDAGTVRFADEAMIKLPGMSDLAPLIPQIDYGSALSILNAMLDELKSDLPELRYYEAQASSNVSGVALRYALADAIDRVLEARGNGEAALARADAMALTLGQRAGLKGFAREQIGTFEAGDFEHTFGERPIIELTGTERATVVNTWVQGGLPLITALRREGWSDDEIAAMHADQEAALRQQIKLAKLQQDAAAEAKAAETDQALASQQKLDQHKLTVAQQEHTQTTALDLERARKQAALEAELHPQRLALKQAEQQVDTAQQLDRTRKAVQLDAELAPTRAQAEATVKREVGAVEQEQQIAVAKARQPTAAARGTPARTLRRRRAS